MKTSLQDLTDIVELIRDIDHRDSIPPTEFESANELAAQLVKRGRDTETYFLLGSFQEGDRDLLNDLKERICSRPNMVAYTMDEFTNINGITKFITIALVSDCIIQIVERDTGGEVLEEGMLVRKEIRDSTYILKRRGQEKDRYNWMQSNGVFKMFDDLDRLYEWDTEGELIRQVDEILDKG